MKRKGISPLIAAVLMIAFTMAIASLFSGWIQETTSQSQENVNQQREQTLQCNQMGIDITDASAGEATVEQTRGETAIGNITVTWSYSDSTSPQQGYVNISSSRGLGTTTAGESGGSLSSVSAASQACNSVTDEYVEN